MAYNTESLTKLEALKELAAKVKSDYATKTELAALDTKVQDIVTTGGEPNVIESVKVNGAALTVTDKAVDVTVPTKVSELTNDSEFQTGTEVAQAIQTALAATGYASFQVVNSVPEAASAEANVLYLVMNSETGYYDIYALISDSVVRLDDTSVDLTNYVEKETGKGLSTNDYTDADKAKLDGLSNYTHPSYTAQSGGLYKVTVDETGHVSAVEAVTTDDITGLIEIATLTEVQEMLDEVFTASGD